MEGVFDCLITVQDLKKHAQSQAALFCLTNNRTCFVAVLNTHFVVLSPQSSGESFLMCDSRVKWVFSIDQLKKTNVLQNLKRKTEIGQPQFLPFWDQTTFGPHNPFIPYFSLDFFLDNFLDELFLEFETKKDLTRNTLALSASGTLEFQILLSDPCQPESNRLDAFYRFGKITEQQFPKWKTVQCKTLRIVVMLSLFPLSFVQCRMHGLLSRKGKITNGWWKI